MNAIHKPSIWPVICSVFRTRTAEREEVIWSNNILLVCRLRCNEFCWRKSFICFWKKKKLPSYEIKRGRFLMMKLTQLNLFLLFSLKLINIQFTQISVSLFFVALFYVCGSYPFRNSVKLCHKNIEMNRPKLYPNPHCKSAKNNSHRQPYI